MTLGDYLSDAAGKPWIPGEHDCTAWPARWAQIELPGYTTDSEALALIEEAGDLPSLWEAYIDGRLPELPAGTEYQPGDVGIIEAVSPFLLDRGGSPVPVAVGAIFTGKRWAFVPKPGGIASMYAYPIRAWRVECRRP